MPVEKLSISVDEWTKSKAAELVDKRKYRNLSHLFEEGAKMIFAKEGIADE